MSSSDSEVVLPPIPSLGEHLAGAPIAVGERGKGRVHQLANTESVRASAHAAVQTSAPAIERRVHRIAGDDEDQDLKLADALPPRPVSFATVAPVIQPSAPPSGDPMPRGLYERKPKSGGAGEAQGEGTKPVTRKKRAAKKTNGSTAKAAPARRRAVGEASFSVSDAGAMLIRDGQQEIQLERADVQRLAKFLENTKAIRG